MAWEQRTKRWGRGVSLVDNEGITVAVVNTGWMTVPRMG